MVEKLCDRVLIINRGSIIRSLSTSELKEVYEDASLEDFFLSVTGEGSLADGEEGV